MIEIRQPAVVKRFALVVLLSLFGLGSACSGPDRIVVGSKNFTEQIILGELVAQHIERRTGIPVERRLNLGGTQICHEAMLSGGLDIYVEYTGTGLTAVLKEEVSPEADDVYEKVRALYRERFHLEWTEPLGFNNTFAMIVRSADALASNLKTISDAVPMTRKWTAGFGYEFMEREDGFPGLARVYGLQFPASPRVMDLGLTYKALASGEVDMIAGNSTDGTIESLNLYALEDDRHYFPPYDAVPVVREEALAKHSGLREALKELGGKIDEEQMRRLNYLVDGEFRDVREVAADFLAQAGL